MASINIKTLKPQIGKLHIKHPVTGETEFDLPDGTKGPLELHFVGRNSKQWYDFMKKLKSGVKDVDASLLFSKISDESHEFIASLIIGWVDNGALDAPYSEEEALALVKNPENFWILEQIYPFILEEAHFFSKD